MKKSLPSIDLYWALLQVHYVRNAAWAAAAKHVFLPKSSWWPNSKDSSVENLGTCQSSKKPNQTRPTNKASIIYTSSSSTLKYVWKLEEVVRMFLLPAESKFIANHYESWGNIQLWAYCIFDTEQCPQMFVVHQGTPSFF